MNFILSKKIALILLVFSILFLNSIAFAQQGKMIADTPRLPTTEECLSKNFSDLDTNVEKVEEYKKSCLMAASPTDISSCENIPEKYGEEVMQKCYFNGRFCDKLINAELKQACEKRKADYEQWLVEQQDTQRKFKESKKLWGIVQSILIPLTVFGIITEMLFRLSKKKLGKKGAIIRIGLIVLLAVIWFVLTAVFCLPPCVSFRRY